MTGPLTGPWVTAIVPTYNSTDYLDRTLGAIDAQTWPHLRVIIGDDASTDHSVELLDAFAATRPHVDVVKRETNLGWMDNINDLMRRVDTPYLFYMPHDDVIEPSYVEKLVTALDATPGAIIAYSDLRFTRLGEGTQIWRLEAMSGISTVFWRALTIATRPPGWWIPHRGIFRTEAFHQIGGLKPNEAGEYSADFAWVYHLSLLGSFVRVPEVLYHKYYGDLNVSKNWTHPSKPSRILRRAALQETQASGLPVPLRALILLGLVGQGALKAVQRRILFAARKISLRRN